MFGENEMRSQPITSQVTGFRVQTNSKLPNRFKFGLLDLKFQYVRSGPFN